MTSYPQDFSDCQLTELPAAVFDLTGLIELSLAGNQLQTLPADISKLTGLKKLVLAGNLFTQLPVELFGLTSLEGLWVHGNLLREMPQQLGQLTKLKNLSLAGGCGQAGRGCCLLCMFLCLPALLLSNVSFFHAVVSQT